MSTAPHRDVAAVASGVKPAFVASADLDVVLSAIAERVAEAVGVWGCDVYEYREESDTLVATALWAQEITDRDREWLGTSCTLAERPSYGPVIRERALLECHLGDPDLCAAEAELMRRWGARSALTMPLVFQEEAVGAITVVETREARRFSSEDLQVLELMAVPAAVALQNARMFRREAEQNRRLQALFSASRAIASTIHLEESLGVITGAARQALDAAECVINTLDPLAGTLTTVAHQRRDARSGRAREIGTAYPLADVPADRDVLPKGAIVEECVSDPAIDARSRRWMIDTGEKARLIVPLVYEDDPIGLLVFRETAAERHFTDEEREVAAALGRQASAAIRHAQLLPHSEEQRRQLKRLHESSRAISSSVDLEEVLAIVARTTAEALGAEQCQIQEYHAEANAVRPVAFWQRHQERPEPDSLLRTFSLEDQPDERRLSEGRTVVQQQYSAPDLAAPTRATMEKYGDLA